MSDKAPHTQNFYLKKEFVLLLFFIAAFIATRSVTWFNNYLMLDDVDHFLEAKRIFSSFSVPAVGPGLAGTGARIPGGGYYELLAIPALLFDSPLYFQIYSAALMLCASVFFIWTVRKHFGAAAMSVTASLLLFSPRMMQMESGMWNPYYAAMLSLVLASMLLNIFSGKDSPLSLFLLLPLSALISQVHFTAFFYLPLILAVYIVFFYKGKNKKFFWYGLSGAAALYLPYLLSELGSRFGNTAAILSMHNGAAGFSFPVLSYMLLFPSLDFMMSGYMSEGIKFLSKIPWYALWPALPVYAASLVLPAAAFIYCISAFFRKPGLSGAGYGASVFFLLVLGGLVFAFMVFGIPANPIHYYFPVFAFAFFPPAVFLERIEKNMRRNIMLLLSAVFITAGSVLSLYYFADVIRPFSISRQYGYINAILDNAEGRPFAVRTEYEKYFYEVTAREILHRKWNENDSSSLKYAIDKKENLTNTGPADRIYGDDLMGAYRLR